MKKLARVLASYALKLTLFGVIITAALLGVTSSPDRLKQSLDDSGLYDNLIENVLQLPSEDDSAQAGKPGGDVNQQVMRDSAKAALPPETLKTSTEQFIDGVYRWLNGEVALPDFHIDLTDAKQRFVQIAAQTAETHVAGLAPCTAQETRDLDPDADPLSLSCRPPGVTAATARDEVITELSNNEVFLKDPVISADTLPGNDDGENFFQASQNIPEGFQRLKSLPWILLGLSLALGVAVFFLSDSQRRGARSLAITLAGTGVLAILTTWLGGFVFDRLAQPEGALGQQLAGNSLHTSLLTIARSLAQAFNSTVLKYSLAYIIIGGLTLVALKYLWKQPTETKKV